jgi:tricorn protease-like protein
MPMPAYLRYPDVRGDLLTFTAADDVWLAPLGGGRAWRLTDDQMVHTPADFDSAADPQLDRAIAVALEQLAATPAVLAPPLPGPRIR